MLPVGLAPCIMRSRNTTDPQNTMDLSKTSRPAGPILLGPTMQLNANKPSVHVPQPQKTADADQNSGTSSKPESPLRIEC